MYGTGSYGKGFNTGKVLHINGSDDLDLSKAVLKLLLGTVSVQHIVPNSVCIEPLYYKVHCYYSV